MPVVARPNLLTCLRSRLLQVPEITDLVSSAAGWTDGRTEARIASQLHDKWKLPTRAIRLQRVGGAPDGEDYRFGIWRSRVDVFCYGAHGHEAAELAELVLAVFCPRQRTDAGFTLAGCVVEGIEPEADIYADVERDTRYPFAWAPYRVRFRAVGAA